MTVSSIISTAVKEDAGGSAPPDWDNVPFDVGCARYGHDLRGLAEHVCPACGLEFDWADAVPVEQLTCLHCGYHLYGLRETRCPECGEPFTWEEALEQYHRRRKPLFEYRWREEPIRSLLASWRLAMRPGKLWKIIDLHDPPSVGALLGLLGIALMVFSLAPVVLGFLGGYVVRAIEALAAGPGYYYLGPWESGYYDYLGWASFILSAVLWSAGTLGALLMLRQSMALCKVRNGHVLRVHAYTMLLVAAGPILFCALAFVHDVGGALFPSLSTYESRDTIDAITGGFVFIIWFWAFCSIALGYRLYMRMRHAWAVALASQIVAILLALIGTAWVVALENR